MDNQFGGRTDDHLFSDDFEPAPPELAQPIPTPTTMSHDNATWTEARAAEELHDLATTQVECPIPVCGRLWKDHVSLLKDWLRLSKELKQLKQLREQPQVLSPVAKDFVPGGHIGDTSSNDKQKEPKSGPKVLHEAKKAGALVEVGNEEEGEDDTLGSSHEQSTTMGSGPPSGGETMGSGAGTGITTPADGPPQDDSHEPSQDPAGGPSSCRTCGTTYSTSKRLKEHHAVSKTCKGSDDQ